MSVENIVLIIFLTLLPILCYITGRMDGIDAAIAKYEKYYDELCKRLIKAIRRAENERDRED